MALKKLTPNALVGEQVFEAMHQGILNGTLKAGERLRIRNVAEKLGTSVMPVREAIRRLEESGLVVTEPYRGAVVRDFTAEELLQVYAVRRLLEVEAARWGAARIDGRELAAIRSEFESMNHALAEGDVTRCLAHDERFLTLIYAASGNPVLLDSIERLWARCRAYKLIGARKVFAAGNQPVLWQYQEQMLDALEKGDAALMGELTEESILAAMRRIESALPLAVPL